MKKDKKTANEDTLNLFHPLVRQWFREQVGTPTDIQNKAWPEIAKGNHVLVTAPTGSGKTLTAFLWAINNFLVSRQPMEKMRVLYISPLKALNNDIQRNLNKPLEELQGYFDSAGMTLPMIRTAVRSGDTEPAERRHMQRHPPEILITTPESLNVLLTSKSGRQMLTGIATVILDEIHAVLPNKRGTYLITAVERLVPLCGEFQRISLSATVKPLDKVADFIGGYQLKELDNTFEYKKRRVSVVRSHMQKKYHIQVNFPGKEEKKRREQLPPEVWWPILMEEWRKIMNQNYSTLFFANSRRMVEKVTRLINESEGERVYSHHGSLSKEIRSVVEKRFKDGELSAIIATSSLELGIDIGSVDEVVLIQVPYSIASAIQRIGRSGHGVGEVSMGRFYPLHSRDLVEAAVVAANIDGEAIETIAPIEAPLDVLAQVLLSMTVPESRNIDELFAEIRTSYPYHRLSRREFDLVIQMLAGKYADTRIRELKTRLMVDRVKNTAKARDNVPALLFASGGVIPDRGYFNMRAADSKAKIGELDEEFVWERSLGDAFPFGNQIWRIQRITHNDVEVSQVVKSNTLIPFWRAEEMNRSYHLSQMIGEFLKIADAEMDSPDFHKKLRENHHMSDSAAKELVDYLKRQKKETKRTLPHRNHILVEHFHDPVNRADCKQTVLHTLWGGPVNRPLAFALSAAWEQKYGYPLEVFVNNDCIMLNLPHEFGVPDVLSLVKPDKIRSLLRVKMESTGYFGARFRENAQRALLLPRKSFHQRMPLWLNRLRSKKLLEGVSHYDDFPILLETWRGCLNQEFEIDILLHLMEEIHTGEIHISEVSTKKPSPFAENIIWRQTNQYMYEDDSPRSKLRTNLSDSLIKEVMYSSHLRPRFSQELLRTFQQKLHRVAEGYSPATSEELLQWVKERLYIPANEWEELLAAMKRDHELDTGELVDTINDRLYPIKDSGQLAAMVALENLPRVSHALKIAEEDARKIAEQLNLTDIFSRDEEETLVEFLHEWLRYYGPIPQSFLATLNKSFSGGSRGAVFSKRGLATPTYSRSARCRSLGASSQKFAEKTKFQKVLVKSTSLAVGDNRLLTALETLLEEGHIIVDEFRAEEEAGEEICDTENLEILLRMRRSRARPAIEPLTIDEFPLFLATYQGLASPGDNLEDLQNSLENLFGYPAKAGVWEGDILPARLNPYYSSWLDTALRENELVWFGCGSERISFCFEADYELFALPFEDAAAGENAGSKQDGAIAELEKLFSETRGKFALEDIMESVKLSSQELTGFLWQMTWEGRITNDHFNTIRSGVMNRFKPEQLLPPAEIRKGGRRYGYDRGRRRIGFNRWQSTRSFAGNWYALPSFDSGPVEMDALDRQELVKDRIRQLFIRYGILFREMLWNELPGFRWSNIFPVLRLMELSGEIVSGHFFKGIPGLQFCTPTALGLLTRGLPEDAIYWMNAVDPASPCGIALEELRPMFPHRLPTTHLVFHGKKLVLVSKKNGKELTIYVEPKHPRIPDYLEFFKTLISREFQPLKYISVETVNEESVLDSPYKEVLRDFGFKKDYKSMALMKEY
ncbi:MAG: DEAD/DEAH box helicase [Candidatus Aminicenantes bacterium]|jgi:ATP-dependent Lhr-like helicase